MREAAEVARTVAFRREVRRSYLLAGRPQPGGRDPAPGALALVQDLVNTVDREHGPDLLDDAAGLTERLPPSRRSPRPRGPARPRPPAVRPPGHRREALRGLLLANNREAEPADARVVLEAAAQRAHLAV